jgi:putative membrane protein
MTFRKTHLAAAISALLLGLSTSALPQQGTTQGDRSAAGAGTTNSSGSGNTGTSSGDRSSTRTERAKDNDRASRNAGNAAKNDNKVARADRRVIETIARKNQAEVELSNLAKQNAANDQVKQFADKMVSDHQKAGDELKQIASQAGVDMPTDLDRKHKRAADNLAKAKGADFDRKFMSQMVDDHESTLKDLRKASKDAKDPQLKAFADKTAQHVEQHLQEARQIASGVGAMGGARSAARRDNDRNAATGSSARRSDASKDGASGSSGTGPTQGREPATSSNKDSSGNK